MDYARTNIALRIRACIRYGHKPFNPRCVRCGADPGMDITKPYDRTVLIYRAMAVAWVAAVFLPNPLVEYLKARRSQ